MQAEKHLGKTNPEHIWFFFAQVIRKTFIPTKGCVYRDLCPCMAAAAWAYGPATTEKVTGEPTWQICAPKHAGNTPGHIQGNRNQEGGGLK